MSSNVGILGIGVFLPPVVRKNDWWPEAEVNKWRQKMAFNITRGRTEPTEAPTEGIRRTLGAMGALVEDPFRGTVERRVMPDDMLATDMETAAARDAIERAGIDAGEIGAVLSYTMCPDFLYVNNSCVVHRNLGLKEHCLSINADGVCNSFGLQCTLGEQLVRGGQAKYVLLIQSSAMTRLQGHLDPHSAWFGDGATAVILGKVSEGKGLLASSHHTDGKLHKAMVVGVPGKRWFDDGRCLAYSEDTHAAREMLLTVADRAYETVQEALAKAGFGVDDVRFYACHQAAHWMPTVTRDFLQLKNAKMVDTFPWAANLSAANLPLALATGERDGVLQDGDLVATFAGGTGMSWTSIVLRWGR